MLFTHSQRYKWKISVSVPNGQPNGRRTETHTSQVNVFRSTGVTAPPHPPFTHNTPRSGDQANRLGAMASPFSLPYVSSVDEGPLIEPRQTCSFDDADLDLCYSEDVSTVHNSPLAGPPASFMLRRAIEEAPPMPSSVASPSAIRIPHVYTSADAQRRRPQLSPPPRQDIEEASPMPYSVAIPSDDMRVPDADISPLAHRSGLQSSPLARPMTSFIPRKNIEVEPTTAAMQSEALRIPNKEQSGPLSQRSRPLPRLEVLIDCDMCDEEDDILNTSDDTAVRSQPVFHPEGGVRRSASASAFLTTTSPLVASSPRSTTEDLPDLTVPSLTPVPMRRVASTPIQHPERPKVQRSSPSPGYNRIPSPMARKQPIESPYKAATPPGPYAFRRQISLPVTAGERTAPAIRFTDNSQHCEEGTPKNRNRGASLFRSGRAGTPTSATRRETINNGPSPRRSSGSMPSPSRRSSNAPSPSNSSRDSQFHSRRSKGREKWLDLQGQPRLEVNIDYDMSDEEDDILDSSPDTAAISQTVFFPESGVRRSASLSAFVTAPSPLTTDDLPDLTVPSLTPVPMRRVASTPIQHLERTNVQKSAPSPGYNRVPSPMARKQPIESPYKAATPPGPYAFRRQMSLPVTTGERTAPTIRFADESPHCEEGTPNNKNRGGASIFRSGRAGTPTSASLRDTISSGPSPRRSSGNISSPSRRNSNTPSASKSRDARRSKGREKWLGLHEIPMRSNSHTDGSEEELLAGARVSTIEEERSYLRPLHIEGCDDEEEEEGSQKETSTNGSKDDKIFLPRQQMQYILYLSAFSIFGSSIRVLLNQFFGAGCENADDIKGIVPGFCVTSTGRTIQVGGALFVDLPANILGCFIMGLMTSLKPDIWPALPWFHHNHPLQQHDAYHVGIRTGLCGSITTFASWNAQMIVMLDGTGTVLGPQVASALAGYLIGFFCAVCSFLAGTNVSTWLTRWRNPDIAREEDEEMSLITSRSIDHGDDYTHGHRRHSFHEDVSSNQAPPDRIIVFPAYFTCVTEFCHRKLPCLGSHRLPFVAAACLLVAYAIAGFVFDIPFYRTMFLTALFTPSGALLRWQLSKWNTRILDQRWGRLGWLPWGTYMANMIGAVSSILLLAILTRYLLSDAENNQWAITLVTALRAGFSGSLSTVSTMMKEMFELTAKYPYHAKAYRYAFITVTSGIILSLMLYSPIVRSN